MKKITIITIFISTFISIVDIQLVNASMPSIYDAINTIKREGNPADSQIPINNNGGIDYSGTVPIQVASAQPQVDPNDASTWTQEQRDDYIRNKTTPYVTGTQQFMQSPLYVGEDPRLKGYGSTKYDQMSYDALQNRSLEDVRAEGRMNDTESIINTCAILLAISGLILVLKIRKAKK